MTIDQKFIHQLVNVTTKAAIASYQFVGKKDKIAADKAAVDSMRSELNQMNIKGEIVIVIDGSKKTNSYNNLDLSKSIKKEFLKKMSASDASKLISMLTKKNRL